MCKYHLEYGDECIEDIPETSPQRACHFSYNGVKVFFDIMMVEFKESSYLIKRDNDASWHLYLSATLSLQHSPRWEPLGPKLSQQYEKHYKEYLYRKNNPGG